LHIMCVECVYRCTSFSFMYLLFLCFLLPYGVIIIKNRLHPMYLLQQIDDKSMNQANKLLTILLLLFPLLLLRISRLGLSFEL